MTREWKPDDVAMVTCSDGKERRGMCGPLSYSDKGLIWRFSNGEWRWVDQSTADPLVVLDPEDDEHVDAFRTAWLNSGLVGAKAIRTALRSLIADPVPPKPNEPRGLGAVVVDRTFLRWVRVQQDADRAWAPIGRVSDSGHWRKYADITAVTVLSEGVTE